MRRVARFILLGLVCCCLAANLSAPGSTAQAQNTGNYYLPPQSVPQASSASQPYTTQTFGTQPYAATQPDPRYEQPGSGSATYAPPSGSSSAPYWPPREFSAPEYTAQLPANTPQQFRSSGIAAVESHFARDRPFPQYREIPAQPSKLPGWPPDNQPATASSPAPSQRYEVIQTAASSPTEEHVNEPGVQFRAPGSAAILAQSAAAPALPLSPRYVPPVKRPGNDAALSDRNQVPSTAFPSGAKGTLPGEHSLDRSAPSERNPYRDSSTQPGNLNQYRPAQTAPVNRYENVADSRPHQVGPPQAGVPVPAEQQPNVITSGGNGSALQQQTPQSATQADQAPGIGPAAAPPVDGQSLSLQIQQRSKELEASANIDEPSKAEGLNVLKSAAEWWARAEQWNLKTAEYQAEIENVPQAIAQAKQVLEQPIQTPEPNYPADASLVQLEKLLAEQEAAFKSSQQTLADQESLLQQRAERKTALAKQLEQAEKRSEEIQVALKTALPEGEAPELRQARYLELLARDIACQSERKLLQAESLRHEAVTELLPLQRDLAQRQVKQQETLVVAWREGVAAFRKKESERQACEARERVAQAHPALRELAERNAELAERRTELAEKIEAINGELERINATLKETEEHYQGIIQKVKVVGLSSTVGMLLRKQRHELPRLAHHRDRLAKIEIELPQVQLASLELEEDREQSGDIDASLDRVIQGLEGAAAQFNPAELRQIVREFLETRKKYLDDLLNDNDAYQDRLGELDIVTRKLTAQTAEFTNYIDKHVLWIRSAEPLTTNDVRQFWAVATAIGSPGALFQTGGGVWQALVQRPISWTALAAGFICLHIVTGRVRRKLQVYCEHHVADPTCSLLPILGSLGLTMLSSLKWPMLTWLVGWQLSQISTGVELIAHFADGLMTTSLLCIAIEVIRQTCMPGALAEQYLHWPVEQLQLLRKQLHWLVIASLPTVFAIVVIEGLKEGEWADSAGRLMFIAGMGLLTVLSHGLLYPSGAFWRPLGEGGGNIVYRLRHLWYSLSLAAPVGLACLAASGYYYSARELAVRLKMSFWLLLGVVIIGSLLTKLLLVIVQGISRHRHRLVKKVIPTFVHAVHLHRPAGALDKNSTEHSAASDTVLPAKLSEEDPVDLEVVRTQVTRLVQGAAVATFLLGSWLIWAEVLPAFQVLDRIELWTTVRETMEEVTAPDGSVTMTLVKQPAPTTLTHLLLALVIFQVTLLAARNLPGLLEIAVLNRLPIDRGGRYAVSMICRYALTVTGFIFGFRMVGLTWNSVQWLVAAMTVGLGFGLQEIFANFVSGLIILFERPVRVGDLVTISGVTGVVTRVQIRATTITDPDRRELIVPNKNLITAELINWTLSDSVSRVVIPIGVAYGMDVATTQRALLAVGKNHPQVLKDPEPTAVFVSFGDSTLNFELRVFLGSREFFGQVLHELNSEIERTFREAEIEIAFPQQEVTIKSIAPIIPYLKQPQFSVQEEPAPAARRAA